MDKQLRDGIDWVGYIDWSIRDFHGYETDRGSSYNAYLVRDEKTVLVDTVKAPYVERLLENVAELIDPSLVDYVVCNHAEPDHSGGLPRVMAVCVNAELVCNEKCKEILSMYYDTGTWRFKVVGDGESLSIGKRTLQFINTPMVHWPESMFTYVPEEKLLFSMDAFGQHYASAHRFDDEESLEVLMSEAKTYYANIVMLYGKPIQRVLQKASGLPLDIIAPSHGIIWRKNIGVIVGAYNEWSNQKLNRKVLVVFDTMWKSTELIANAIMDGVLEYDVDASLVSLRSSHITDVAREALDSAVIAVGSPTLNKTLMPTVAAALTYLKGLSPAGRSGMAFGSYGWSKGGADDVEKYLVEMKVDVLRETLQCQYVPTKEFLDECRIVGRMLAEKAMEVAV